MRTYPDILPAPTWPEYGFAPRSQSVQSDVESGTPRARRISRAKVWDVDMAFRMTDTEAGLFWPWYFDDAWALSGDSESFSIFTQSNLSSITYPTIGPDGQAAARFVENTGASTNHGARLNLSMLPQNATVAARATFRAGTRGFARVSLTNWAGLFCTANVDLSTGTFTGGSNYLTRAIKDRGNGWWRIELTATAGTGAATPFVRFDMGSASNTYNYTGDGASYLDVCEQQVRVVTNGLDGFLRTDSSGNILGAGGGSAWFTMSLPFGGGMRSSQVMLPTAQGKPLNSGGKWVNSFKAVVQ